ncbi:MAG: hypothetical protein ACSW8C_01505 [bacterium]
MFLTLLVCKCSVEISFGITLDTLLNNPPEGSTCKFIEQEIRSTGLNDFQLGKRLCHIFITKYTKCLADTDKALLKKVTNDNIYKICKTKNGQHLLIRIIRLLNQQSKMKENNIKILFSWGDSITAEGADKKILLKYEDLKTGTGFYLKNGEIELTPHADIYIFHELLHLYHYLEDEEYYNRLENPGTLKNIREFFTPEELKTLNINTIEMHDKKDEIVKEISELLKNHLLPVIEDKKIADEIVKEISELLKNHLLPVIEDKKIADEIAKKTSELLKKYLLPVGESNEIAKKNFELLKKHFPPVISENVINLEEMRTIIGSPYPIGDYDDLIICENSYRFEKGFLFRLNLLDGDDKKQKCPYFRQLETLIEYNSRYYLSR